MNWELFTAFIVITMILVVTPGPIVTLVIATGASHGVRAALTTVAGTTIVNGILIAAIAFSLSWILKSSAELFDYLRWIGAAYLIWLGIKAWRKAGRDAALPPPRRRVHLWRGMVVALTNPKTIAFFTAFLPQFIDPALPAERQLVVMCIVSVLLAGCTDAGWGIAAGFGRAWLVKSARAKWLGRMSGAMLIGGGIWLSLTRRPA